MTTAPSLQAVAGRATADARIPPSCPLVGGASREAVKRWAGASRDALLLTLALAAAETQTGSKELGEKNGVLSTDADTAEGRKLYGWGYSTGYGYDGSCWYYGCYNWANSNQYYTYYPGYSTWYGNYYYYNYNDAYYNGCCNWYSNYYWW